MEFVAGIRFRPAGRIYYYDAQNFPDLKKNDHVIVETSRGREAARVVIAPKEIDVSELDEPIKLIERIATEDDLRQYLAFKAKEHDALQKCHAKVLHHELPMKLVEAEYTFDGSRLTFYFVAEERVDFRALVRDLAATFHTRIELRQIGARDHAKHLSGLGPCGKSLCCSSWLTDFGAVSIKMAKEQSLPLNPAKISGVCGRLMCCLAYENSQYIDAKQTMPTLNEIIMTPAGPGHVVAINVPHSSVDVLLESGATITVTTDQAVRADKLSYASLHGGGCHTNGGNGSCSAHKAEKRGC
jgi:cell fate regulator YaaT (PSP1 superfamily)